MMTINGRFQVLDECYENTGGNIYVYVATVYDALVKATRYVMYSDDGNQLASVDFVFQDIDYDDSMSIAHYNEEEQRAYDSEGNMYTDNDLEQLFEYCWVEYIKRDCKQFTYTKHLDVDCLPMALERQMTNEYREYLKANGLLVETDGEKIIIDSNFTEPAEEDSQHIKSLKELKAYMDEKIKLMDGTDEQCEQFYGMKATLSFGEKIVVLDNCAAVFNALQDAIDFIISEE